VLKFLFWALLCANALLFAYGQGYLGTFKGNEREPARMRNQLATDKLTLVPGEQARAASGAGATPAAPPPVQEPPARNAVALIACTQAGPFTAADARRFETRLARLDLPQRQERIPVPYQEVTSHLVYLPPSGGKEGADRRAAELRGRGVTNFFIMQGDSPLKWAISLGVFKTENGAQTLLASLNKQGVRGARILPRGPQGTRFAYRFHDVDPDARRRLMAIADEFQGAQLRGCR
jgi:hypothetical protein